MYITEADETDLTYTKRGAVNTRMTQNTIKAP